MWITYLVGYAHSAATQAICQLGKMLLWHEQVMQEHPQLIKRASAWSRKDSWTAPVHLFGILGSCCATLYWRQS